MKQERAKDGGERKGAGAVFREAASGAASALPHRAELERAFGTSLDGVRAYLGRAQALAPLNARAATSGEMIAFAESQPDVGLVAHEVAHVLQQRDGGGGGDGLAPADAATEHEADELAEQAVKRLGGGSQSALPPLQPRRRAAHGIHLKSYGQLNMMGRARVDAKAEAKFAEKAETWESEMAKRVFDSDDVAEIVREMTRRLKRIVDAWAQHTGLSRAKVYAQEFRFREANQYYGAFSMTAKAVNRVLTDVDNQPLRKQLKLVYNATRNNNLGKWLKLAAAEMANPNINARNIREKNKDGNQRVRRLTRGFAQDSGLSAIFQQLPPNALTALQQIAQNEKKDFKDGKGKVHHGLSRSDALSLSPLQGPQRTAKRYKANEGMDLLEQETVTVGQLPDLTTGELRQLARHYPALVPMIGTKPDKQAFLANPNQKIPWEQGREGIDVFTNHPAERTAANLYARMDGGPSGSTDLMMHAAEHLGFNSLEDKRKMRLALVGWMILNRDHSFYEIMNAADAYGVPFIKTDPDNGPGHPRPAFFYEAKDNFRPYSVKKLRSILPERQFPGYFLSSTHKDEVAEHLALPDDTSASLGQSLIGRGVPATVVNDLTARFDRTSLAALDLLWREVWNTPFVNGGNPQSDRTNRWLRRALRKKQCFIELLHRHPSHADLCLAGIMNYYHPTALSDEERFLRAGAASLPAMTAGTNQKRQHLVAHGAPAAFANDVQWAPDFILDLLVRAQAVVAGAGLVAPATANSQTTNLEAIGKVRATVLWLDIAKFRGEKASAEETQINLLLHGFVEHVQPGVGHLVYEPSHPMRRKLLAKGVPDAALRRVKDSDLAHLDALRAAVKQIHNTVAGAPAQILALKNLQAVHPQAHAALKTFWLPVLAKLASVYQIDLTTDAQLKAASTTADLFRPGAINLVGNELTNVGNTQSQFWKQTYGDDMMTTNVQRLGVNGAHPLHQSHQDLLGISQAERAAINEYSRLAGMGQWQDFLKDRDLTTTGNGSFRKNLPKIQLAISGLNKLPAYAAGPVYCGKERNLAGASPRQMAKLVAKYPVGKVLHSDNFLSTSKNVQQCFAFTHNGYDIVWVISGVRTGKHIELVSTNQGEEEVLFPPGARYVVTRVQDDVNNVAAPDKKLWIYLTEV